MMMDLGEEGFMVNGEDRYESWPKEVQVMKHNGGGAIQSKFVGRWFYNGLYEV